MSTDHPTREPQTPPRQPIGLISGLGPLAGADVLWKLLEHAATTYGARDDIDYPDVIMVSHGIPGFDATGHINRNFEHNLVGAVKALEVHRPAVIGVACNTAHLLADTMIRHTGATFVNIIEETAKQAARRDWTYLLISSSTTRQQGLYHQALQTRGVHFIEVDATEQVEIDHIVDLVMAFQLDQAGDQLADFLLRAADHYPFSGIIAGCTELPIALDHAPALPDTVIVESNRALADALVDRWEQPLGHTETADRSIHAA